jgi:hypothetical protein
MIARIDPPIPVTTPRGPALAHFLVDYGSEMDLIWVCFQDSDGTCWSYRNQDIRAQKNITMGRTLEPIILKLEPKT